MKKHVFNFLSPFFLLVFISSSFAQLNINTSMTPQQLVQNVLVGGGVTVSNLTMTGLPAMYGSFTNGATTNLGFDAGIILCTGNVTDISQSGSSVMSISLGQPGDANLDAISSAGTFDACVLEFDFVSFNDSIQLRYVFGSEEYPEYVNSAYNDIFAFFLTGPNPLGGNYTNQNVAIIPGTTLPVSINNVNNVTPSYPQYYVDNSSGATIVFDGFTTPLTALASVVPCSTYHIKFAIADVGDGIYDSGVFLEANSFSSNGSSVIPTYSNTAFGNNAVEGCSDGMFIFTLPSPSSSPTTINFTIGGTAVNGIDYSAIPNSITIPAGQDSAVLIIDPFIDGLTEGTETVTISVTNTCTTQVFTINIVDNVPTAINILSEDSIIFCQGEPAVINASSGFDAYNWSNGDTTFSTTINSTGMFYITVSSISCGSFTDSIYADMLPVIQVNLSDTINCTASSIILDAGTGFSSYIWSTGDTTQIITAASSGTYFITAVNNNGCLSDDSTNVLLNPILGFDLGSDTSFCQNDSFLLQLPNLYDSYQWSTGDTINQITVDIAGMYYVTVTSATCGGSASDSIYISMNLLPVADAGPNDTICPGASSTLSASGGSSYHWSTGSNSQNINVSPQVTSAYTVTVTNASGCTATDFVLVVVYPAMNASTTQTNVSCGLSNGSASVTVSGGSGSFSYQWNTSPPQYSSTAINLSAATYSVTVTDLTTGCIIIKTVTISNIPAPSVSIQNIINANCNENNGSMTITITGGTVPYNYQWNSVPPQSGQMLINVPPGNYCVTVTDGSGCTATVCGIIQTVAYTAPEICMVSVDTASNQNLVIWEKPVTSGIDEYYIFRESSVGGIYNMIGSQSYSNFSTFTDTSSNSLQQPYRYKLAINDTCGFTSGLSSYHQTIHLTVYSSGGSWSLIWNNYEGFSFSTYNIYRGTSASNMTLLNSVASTVNSYTDLTPPAGTVYYMIEVVIPAPCNPSFKSEDSFGSTISNVANTNEVGISEFFNAENILIYPNPGEGIFTILISCEINKSVSVEILNSLGQVVYTETMNTNTKNIKNINLSKLSKGIYTLKLTIAGKSYFEKIVIE